MPNKEPNKTGEEARRPSGGANSYFQKLNRLRREARGNAEEVRRRAPAVFRLPPEQRSFLELVYSENAESFGIPDAPGEAVDRIQRLDTAQLCCIVEPKASPRADAAGQAIEAQALDLHGRPEKTYRLYPDRPTAVPAKHAFHLLTQDDRFEIGEWDFAVEGECGRPESPFGP